MVITGTFKHRKVELVKEGFDVTEFDDPVYIKDDSKKTYVRVTPKVLSDIKQKCIRF